VYHQGDGVVVVDVVLGLREALERLFGVFESILADEEPRRLGSEVSGDPQWYRPDPLVGVSL
jgi:hypothetical protein